jgi:hypothetical protein
MRGKFDNIECTITVGRNLQSPQFINNPPYTAEIPFNQPLNENFAFPEAVDNDLQGNIVYKIIGYDAAPQYFGITSPNKDGPGSVFVKSPMLANDLTLTYVVSSL